jgi:hypothetical protein
MDIKKTSDTSDARPQGRAAYSPPRLTVFGPVSQITQAGSAGTAEMGMGMDMGMGMGQANHRL